MRPYSNNVKLLLNSDNIKLYYLIEIIVGNTILRHTSTGYDITVNGNIFYKENNLISIDPPQMSFNVDREAYKIQYADPEFSMRSMLEDSVTGANVTVMIGFFNTLDVVLSGVEPGFPLTDLNDILIGYKGVIDSNGYTIDEDNESVSILFECSSPMAALDLSKPYITSQEYVRQLNAVDSAYDQVYVGSKEIELLWGKA